MARRYDTQWHNFQHLTILELQKKNLRQIYECPCTQNTVSSFSLLLKELDFLWTHNYVTTCLEKWIFFPEDCFFFVFFFLWLSLKVALQILGWTFYKNTEKSSLYSQSLLISFHKTKVVETHPTTREIRDWLRPRLTPTENTVYFYMSSSLIYTLEILRRSFKHGIRWTHYGK